MSHFVRNMLEDRGAEALDEEIPITEFTKGTLDLVVAYCQVVEYEPEGRVRGKPITKSSQLDQMFSSPGEVGFFQGLSNL